MSPARARPVASATGLLGIAALLMALAGGLAAQTSPVPTQAPAPTQSPAPAQAPRAPAERPLGERFTLPNGLVVLVAERPGLPIVVAEVGVAAGGVLDPPDKPGLANLVAMSLTRGTASRGAQEIDRAIESVGGSLEGGGGRDGANLSLSVLKKDWMLGLDLLADVLVHPAFPADELDRQREEVRASIRQGEDDPATVAGRLFRPLVFPRHPYGPPVTGTEESLERVSRDDVVAFHRTAYRPETTVVALAGDLTVAEARAALAARLGAWRVTGAAPPPPAVAPPSAPAPPEMHDRALTQATVLLGRATVPRLHPDHYALAVAGHLLGGGSASRLYQRVREERGLVYSIGADHAPTRHGGLFLVEFQSEPARVREVLTLVREELTRLRRERVPEEELARARAYLTGSFPLRLDTTAALARMLVAVEQLGLGLDFPARYRHAIEAVTAEDVMRAARAHWDPDAMSLVVVGNLRAAGLGPP